MGLWLLVGALLICEAAGAQPPDVSYPPHEFAEPGLLGGQSAGEELQGDDRYDDAWDHSCDECWQVENELGYEHEPLYFRWLGGRNSATHGRAIGAGQPLRGTSWLNRPYEVTFEFGALVMVGEPASGVDPANDLFAAIQAGWDWDHYWGGQIRVGWSTPQLDDGSAATNAQRDNLFIGDVSVVYYPWGDSRIRPYTRLGVGLTDIEYTSPSRGRQQENLFTIPLAIGVKYQFRRWAAWRAEFANNVAIAPNGAETFDNMTLTFGYESRFGGRPTGYWAWHPRGHAW